MLAIKVNDEKTSPLALGTQIDVTEAKTDIK